MELSDSNSFARVDNKSKLKPCKLQSIYFIGPTKDEIIRISDYLCTIGLGGEFYSYTSSGRKNDIFVIKVESGLKIMTALNILSQFESIKSTVSLQYNDKDLPSLEYVFKIMRKLASLPCVEIKHNISY